MPRPHPRSLAAFTLTEMVIVITVVALLAGLLVPAIRRALVQGAATRSRSAFQQIVARPDTIAAWDFEEREDEVIRNRAAVGRVNDYHKSDRLHLALPADWIDNRGLTPIFVDGRHETLYALRQVGETEGEGAWAKKGWPRNYTGDTLSVAAWVRIPADDNQYLLWVGDRGNFDNIDDMTFFLEIRNDRTLRWRHAYDEIDSTGAYTGRDLTGQTAIESDPLSALGDRRWHLLVVTKDHYYDESANEEKGRIRFYIDDREPSETTIDQGSGNTRKWRLSIQEASGRDVGVVPANDGSPLAVEVDELLILDRVLAPQEVLGLYNQGRPSGR